jgi:6,7-dimethyl-8-ribityllumazine synthase
MSSPRSIAGQLQAGDARFAIAATRFNGFIVESLVTAAVDALERHGADPGQIDIVRVPGAFELPLTLRKLADTGRYDALIALGCVIRGATPHFDYVAGESAKGVAALAMSSGLPVVNGILTTDSIEQAVERAGTKAGNKGADAAMAAIEMVDLLRRIAEA